MSVLLSGTLCPWNWTPRWPKETKVGGSRPNQSHTYLLYEVEEIKVLGVCCRAHYTPHRRHHCQFGRHCPPHLLLLLQLHITKNIRHDTIIPCSVNNPRRLRSYQWTCTYIQPQVAQQISLPAPQKYIVAERNYTTRNLHQHPSIPPSSPKLSFLIPDQVLVLSLSLSLQKWGQHSVRKANFSISLFLKLHNHPTSKMEPKMPMINPKP